MNGYTNISFPRYRQLLPALLSLGLTLFMVMGTIFIQPLSAQKIAYVGGTLTQNKTWSSDTTYIVWSDLIIPSGTTLTIPPGVEVRVNFGWGIFVWGGNLKVGSAQQSTVDSVRFVANWETPGEYWRWKGITFRNVDFENINFISYAVISSTDVAAVSIIESEQVILNNCSLSDTNNIGVSVINSGSIAIRACELSFNETAAISINKGLDILVEECMIRNNNKLGIGLINSNGCYVSKCMIEGNEDGIRLEADNTGSSNMNSVDSCLIRNRNYNIYAKNSQSSFADNQISNNLIEGGRNGIWLQNDAGMSQASNRITHNIIINTGENVGYGLFNMFDSTQIANNLFWKNNEAIGLGQNGRNCEIGNNSFFQNNSGLSIGGGAKYNEITHNTLSMHQAYLLSVKDIEGLDWAYNNMFTANEQTNMVVQASSLDQDIDLNYWGSTDESIINSLIWDHNDDPLLGTLNYKPYLLLADTISPISPPFPVIKQEVNGATRLSWTANREQDLDAYAVYYGDFSNYRFSHALEAGMQTQFTLEGISFSDSIAVTAKDGEANGADAQLMGHESPFSFAVPFPYSGPDTVVCTNQTTLEILTSSAPFSFTDLYWSTDGDGVFDDENILQAAYYPGDGDLENRSVVLSLHITRAGMVLADSFLLTIVDGPEVYAGKDTTVFSDAVIDLEEATADFYNSLKWQSDGDGSFDADSLLNPNYTPGPQDIAAGKVVLILTAYSDCGATADSVTITLESFFSVEGKVWFGGQAVLPAAVLAIQKSPDQTRARQMVHTDGEGSFIFEKMHEGNYYMYAVPDTHNLYEAIPGYYANKVNWQDAYELPVDANVYDVDIQLPTMDVHLPVGEASISGHVEMPAAQLVNADVFCGPWFADPITTYCNGGLSNMTVFLMDQAGKRHLQYTLTDENGDFFFNRLPYGSYVVDAEKAGFHTSPSPTVSLSPEHRNETGLIMELDQGKIGIYKGDDSPGPLVLKVFPNPASNDIHILFADGHTEAAQLEVFDGFGQRVLHQQLLPQSSQGTRSLQLDISEWRNGFYLGLLRTKSSYHRFTFIKE